MDERTPIADPDADLVRRAQGGAYDAFEALVARHERRTFAIAMDIVRQREDAEDVVQTSFLAAMEHLPAFRGESSFGTWIARIVTNTALKALRKRKGLPMARDCGPVFEEEEGQIAHPDLVADWTQDPAALAERGEARRLVDEALAELPEKHRLVFVLRDVAGLSVAETARELGISEANVKVRLLRARLALRERLTRAFGDEARRVVRTDRHEGEEAGATPAARILDAYREEERP